MRLKDFSYIGWGKEDADEEDVARQDVIYKVFLGDRQIWQKTKDIESSYENLSNQTITTWKIVKDLYLANLTAETNIIGEINWGDNDSTDWRSGQSYLHHYMLEGVYDVAAVCKSYRKNAIIGQFCENYSYANTDPRNTLIGVTFGKIPFADYRLGTTDKGVFEDVTTITNVTIPRGLTRIPPRVLFNTSITKVEIPKYKDDTKLVIENYAIVSNVMEEIYVSSSVSSIGAQALGFTTSGTVVKDLKYYCIKDTEGESYAIRNGIPYQYFVE